FEWPYLLSAIQASLNQPPVQPLARHTHVEVLTGLPVSSAFYTIVVGESGDERVIEISDMDEKLILNVCYSTL
ncbi:hypothetical protein L917_08813, partial [Phytophthora nicotianae]